MVGLRVSPLSRLSARHLVQWLIFQTAILSCSLLPLASGFGARQLSTLPLCIRRRRRGQGPLCFVSTRSSSPSSSSSSRSSSSWSRLRATINFKGESSTSISVPDIITNNGNDNNNNNNSSSLTDWMLSSESDPFFLGTTEYRQRPADGGNTWDAYQPSVDWFGLELVPVFVIRLERDAIKPQVSAVITQARSDIRSGQDTITGRLAGRIMQDSSFTGANRVTWRRRSQQSSQSAQQEQDDGWILEADLSLTVVIPLPPLVPIPPGFNSIGSRIVQSTCKRRLEQFVHNLQASYSHWAIAQQKDKDSE